RGNDLDFLVGQGLEDGEQQILFAQVAGVLDFQLFGEGDQVGRRLVVQFLKRDPTRRDDRLAFFFVLSFGSRDGAVGGGDLFGRGVRRVVGRQSLERFSLGSGGISVANV